MADMIAGSDMDGDIFTVVWDPTIASNDVYDAHLDFMEPQYTQGQEPDHEPDETA